MPTQRQPVSLLQAKGRSHLTKAEIESRSASEVKAPYTGLGPVPAYLNRAQRKEFDYLSAELAALGIYADIDAGLLARYCVAHWQYEKYTKRLAKSPAKKAKLMRTRAEEAVLRAELEGASLEDPTLTMTDDELALELERDLLEMQVKCYRMCEESAKLLGLSVTARCKLVIPQAPEQPRPNRFASFVKSG